MSRTPRDFETFCRSEHPRLVGMLSLYCGDRHVAEELAQDALTRVCRDWRRVERMDRPDAWLRRVAINMARSGFRRRLAEIRARDRLAARTPAAHLDPDAASAVAVRSAVSRLPHRQKAVIVLQFYVGLTLAEAADFLEMPLGTVKSLSHRAIHRLRYQSNLDDHEEEAHAR